MVLMGAHQLPCGSITRTVLVLEQQRDAARYRVSEQTDGETQIGKISLQFVREIALRHQTQRPPIEK